MLIALVIDRLDPRLGGAEHSTFAFARWLLARNHEVHVVARSFSPEVLRSGIVAHETVPDGSRLAFAAEAEKRLAWLRADVVHDMGFGWHCDVFQPRGGSRRAAFEQNLKLKPCWSRTLSRSFSRMLPRYREFEQLVRRQYVQDGRIFVALSKMVADDMHRFHGVPYEQIRLVYNGVDLSKFAPGRPEVRRQIRAELDVEPHELLLLIVAHNFRLKGVPTLLRSVAQLRAEGEPVRLVVVGGKRLAPYQRQAQWMGVGPAVAFVGSIDDPAHYYSAADVYVQPTFYDPCSRVVLEALACGLPVITSRFNGASELMTPGVEGFIVQDPSIADELSSRLRPLFDADRRARMCHAARCLAEHHSLHHSSEQVIGVYDELAYRQYRRAA